MPARAPLLIESRTSDTHTTTAPHTISYCQAEYAAMEEMKPRQIAEAASEKAEGALTSAELAAASRSWPADGYAAGCHSHTPWLQPASQLPAPASDGMPALSCRIER